MSQARKRVRITPQKGINQVTQTSFGLDDIHPVSEHSACPHQPFLDSPLCSTLKHGQNRPMGLDIEQMSEITLPDNHQTSEHHFASFLASDECSEDDKENVLDDEGENILDNYNHLEQRGSSTSSVKRNAFPFRVQPLESTQECDESDTNVGAVCKKQTSLSSHDSTPVASDGDRFIPGCRSVSVSTSNLVPSGEISQGVVFTRMKRKLTFSLSESKDFISMSNKNTPVKERSQTEVLPLEDKHSGVYARKILRLRNAMSTAFDFVAPRIRSGFSLLYSTEEFILRVRQNVLKSVREREEDLSERTFDSEAEYLTANNSILPTANENNLCALCGTESLSIFDFSNHKDKHILKAKPHQSSKPSNLTA